MKYFALLCCLAGMMVWAGCAKLVVPVGPANEEGSVGYPNGTNEGYTSQQLYPVAELSGLSVGDCITGVAARLNAVGRTTPETSSKQLTEQVWSRFDIRIGEGQDFLGPNLADNFVSAPTLVRSGEFTVSPNFFPGDNPSGPHSFSQIASFDTPYVYTGGNLLIEFRLIVDDEDWNFDYWGPSQTAGQFISALGDDATMSDNVIEGVLALQFQITSVPTPSSLIQSLNPAR